MNTTSNDVRRLFATSSIWGMFGEDLNAETGGLPDMEVEDFGGQVVWGKVGSVEVAYLAQELDAALGVEEWACT